MSQKNILETFGSIKNQIDDMVKKNISDLTPQESDIVECLFSPK